MFQRRSALPLVYVDNSESRDPVLEKGSGADQAEALGTAGYLSDSVCSVLMVA